MRFRPPRTFVAFTVLGRYYSRASKLVVYELFIELGLDYLLNVAIQRHATSKFSLRSFHVKSSQVNRNCVSAVVCECVYLRDRTFNTLARITFSKRFQPPRLHCCLKAIHSLDKINCYYC